MLKRLRSTLVVGIVLISVATYLRVNVILQPEGAGTEILEAATVDRGDIVISVSATGAIRTRQQYPLAFAGAGPVEAITVREGDRVLRGQTLARLESDEQRVAVRAAEVAYLLQRSARDALTAPPRDIDVQAAQASLAAAQAQLRAAGISTDPLQVRIAEMQVELARNGLWQTQLGRDQAVAGAQTQAEFNQGLVDAAWQLPEELRDPLLQGLGALGITLSSNFRTSPADANAQVQVRELDVPIAESALRQARNQGPNSGSVGAAQLAATQADIALERLVDTADSDQIAIADAQVRAAQAALSLAIYNLDRAVLTAPADGVVAQINLVEGETPPMNRPAMLLLDDSTFVLDIPVDEADIRQVEVGQPATLVFDALPGQQIEGRVSRVSETATSIGGVVTYLVQVDLQPGGAPLRSGMNATATIIVDEVQDVLRIRNRFVRLDRRSGRAIVTVQGVDGAIRDVEVDLGLRNDTFSELWRGLAEGDRVVVIPRSVELF